MSGVIDWSSRIGVTGGFSGLGFPLLGFSFGGIWPFMNQTDNDARYTDEEAARRRDAVVKHMLSKPPEPRSKPQSRPVKGKESSPKTRDEI